MAGVELGTFGLILLLGFIGLRFARERASMRTRRKLASKEAGPQGASQRA